MTAARLRALLAATDLRHPAWPRIVAALTLAAQRRTTCSTS
jgi:hypothetical protein